MQRFLFFWTHSKLRSSTAKLEINVCCFHSFALRCFHICFKRYSTSWRICLRSVLKDAASFGGFVYEIVDTKRRWTDAEADCVTRGGHLASVTSEDEKDFLGVYVSDEYNCDGR